MNDITMKVLESFFSRDTTIREDRLFRELLERNARIYTNDSDAGKYFAVPHIDGFGLAKYMRDTFNLSRPY